MDLCGKWREGGFSHVDPSSLPLGAAGGPCCGDPPWCFTRNSNRKGLSTMLPVPPKQPPTLHVLSPGRIKNVEGDNRLEAWPDSAPPAFVWWCVLCFAGLLVGRSTPIDYAGRFERMSRMSFSASALALLFVASASSASASSSTGLLLGSSTSSARPSLRPGGVLSTRLRGGGSRKVEFKVFHMPDARPALLAVGYAPSFSPKSFAGRNC